MHDKKQADYGSDDDPFANIRASERFGIPGWLGAIIRANDKVSRIQTFARKGELANESVEDSLLDLAVYAVIALTMYREAQGPKLGTTVVVCNDCNCPASEHTHPLADGASRCTACCSTCRLEIGINYKIFNPPQETKPR